MTTNPGINGAYLMELELDLKTPLNGKNKIKNDTNDEGITFHTTSQWTMGGKLDSVFDGYLGPGGSYGDSPYFSSTDDAVFFYMDMGENRRADVSAGTYWTQNNGYWTYENNYRRFLSAKLYGTNDDPAHLTTAQRISPLSYTLITDLDRTCAYTDPIRPC